MAYVKTVWVNGQAPALDADHLNKIEQGIADAVSVTPQTLSDAQKAQARENIAAAVAGGGVMERATKIEVTSADETYESFCQKVDAVLATMPNVSAKFVDAYPSGYYGSCSDIAVLYKQDDNYASLKSVGSYNFDKPNGFMMMKIAGVWKPIEYIDPPMQLGVEYRTTERYLGKPVYTQIINCGSMPDIGNVKNVSIVAFNVAVVTFISGWCSYYAAMFDESLLGMTMTANNLNIVIKNINREVNSNAVMYALVKYTKTTD